MRSVSQLVGLVGLPLLTFACEGDLTEASNETGGAPSGTGAAAGTGGVVTGGVATTGGVVTTGGVGGLPGTGGAPTGGVPNPGGAPTGGVPGTGGAPTGGAPDTGGAPTGGVSGTGGAPTGGVPNTGGAPTGGVPGTGGEATGGSGPGGAATGGVEETGGAPPTGGSGGGTVAWGEAENPTADCTVGELPAASSFTTGNPKLPDPFTKLDGTRITDRSEWACRREEIRQQALKYIYGDKPIPPAGAVSGSVSTSSISVQVNDGGSTSFTATVNMNGASQPAPAIITYGGSGASAPSGVATINITPTETTGGSGAKSGPFFDVYGSNHPAGYMVSNAWVISRIIDVLEQNPGVIDPYRLGVTGCSRWGKGAFVAGVLDNRIALTIPVESGIGGTVALRLVEQLDTSGEWPYHAISYVRWLSEVALGPFTSGNSAGADNTDRLPVDMHEMMALIAPRGLYIVDNPSPDYAGLDRNSAWVTGNVAKEIFEALGVGDHIAYQGASGGHCQWRTQYTASLNAMVDKFLKGNDAATTGNFDTDLGGPPNPSQYYDFTVPELTGEL